MLMQAQPVYDCWKVLNDTIIRRRSVAQEKLSENVSKTRVIYVTPQGEVFHQKRQ